MRLRRYDGTFARSYRALESYNGSAERDALDQITSIMTDATLWDILPYEDRSAGTRARAFRLLVRGFVRIQIFQSSNKNYPYKLLACAFDPGLSDEVAADAACPRRMDSWTKGDSVPWAPQGQMANRSTLDPRAPGWFRRGGGT